MHPSHFCCFGFDHSKNTHTSVLRLFHSLAVVVCSPPWELQGAADFRKPGKLSETFRSFQSFKPSETEAFAPREGRDCAAQPKMWYASIHLCACATLSWRWDGNA